MKSNGTIRLGAALALLLAFGATSASAFTFKRHQYQSKTLRMRQTKQYSISALKVPRKVYVHHPTTVHITKRVYSPVNRLRKTPVRIEAVHEKRFYESAQQRMVRQQRWTPDFRNGTSFLTSVKIRPGLTGGPRPVKSKVAVRVKSPARPINVVGSSSTNSVKALWGKIRVAD